MARNVNWFAFPPLPSSVHWQNQISILDLSKMLLTMVNNKIENMHLVFVLPTVSLKLLAIMFSVINHYAPVDMIIFSALLDQHPFASSYFGFALIRSDPCFRKPEHAHDIG